MKDMLEMCMVILFGLAWPTSIAKSIKVRSANGKSIFFMLIILVGYICGIMSKIISGNMNYVLFFYLLNFVMVSIDVILYFRNTKLNKQKK